MADRSNDIADLIAKACMAIYSDTDAQLDLKAQAKAYDAPLQNTRLDVVEELAKLSHAQNWTLKEIKSAIKIASKASNAPKEDKAAASVKTLRSEMKLFCDPEIRADVPDLIEFCKAAWDEEDLALAADKDAATPVRKLFSRKYKLVLGIARAVKNDDASFGSHEDIADYCEENDPDEDAEKVAKRLERMTDQLQEIFDEFHNQDISACLDYLREIEAKDLLNSRASHRAQDALAGAAAKPLQPVKPASATPPAPTPPQAPAASEDVAEGAFDPLAATMNDLELLAA